MKTGLLTSSSLYGKYLPNQTLSQLSNDQISAVNLKQNFTHERPFSICKFDVLANRLYLLDSSGTLIHLNLNDNSFSTLKGEKIQNFTIDGNNSLNILYVTPKSELHQVSFQNKKTKKITNLNMNKLLAFQRNYLRDMILCLDYKLLFLCDINKTGQLKIKSLKASKDQVFTNACFASNNRFVILAVKNVEIRIVQIMDLKSIHEIKLPFPVNDLKIQVSYDSKKIAIYGQCNIIFFIHFLSPQTFGYELIQIPFLKSIVQFRFTSQGDIVFLGNDQILYAISKNEPEKAVPILNQQFQVRMMNFDISHDCTKIALVSNRTVMQFKCPKGLRKQIQERQTFKKLQYRKNGFQGNKVISLPILQAQGQDQQFNEKQDYKNNNIQYEDEGQQQEEEDDEKDNDNDKKEDARGPILNLDQIKVKFAYKEQCGTLHQCVSQLKGVFTEVKAQINSVLNNLLANYRELKKNQIQYISKGLLKLLQQYKMTPQQSFKIFSYVVQSMIVLNDKIKHFGLILCPQLVAIIEKKLNRSFVDFCGEQIYLLFSNYFQQKEWIETINWLISPGVVQKIENIPILLICIFQTRANTILRRNKSQYELFGNGEEQQVKFVEIYDRLVKVYIDQRYKSLFSKRKPVDLVVVENNDSRQAHSLKGNDSRLQSLILRQDEIKKALYDLKRSKVSR